MTLQLEVDLASGVPPFEQVRSQVLAHVAAGRLRAGDRLPTIRALAGDLGVAAGTVARAYRELEATGVVTTRRRTGTVVADGRAATDDAVTRAAHALVSQARAAGLADAEVLDVVRGALLAPSPLPGGPSARSAAAPAAG
ncbi:GntR family transcriptional regulator [uncultured Cellulomonas sp.]|uniref:GntR family transcriptional regulator n=1 Tax=uncultured Cellulomonas sp. TaxID=189682 RepID=UPI002612EE52|nr:GntR family transcriptional regulator [uncultured Cellulomonas sp.]